MFLYHINLKLTTHFDIKTMWRCFEGCFKLVKKTKTWLDQSKKRFKEINSFILKNSLVLGCYYNNSLDKFAPYLLLIRYIIKHKQIIQVLL